MSDVLTSHHVRNVRADQVYSRGSAHARAPDGAAARLCDSRARRAREGARRPSERPAGAAARAAPSKRGRGRVGGWERAGAALSDARRLRSPAHARRAFHIGQSTLNCALSHGTRNGTRVVWLVAQRARRRVRAHARRASRAPTRATRTRPAAVGVAGRRAPPRAAALRRARVQHAVPHLVAAAVPPAGAPRSRATTRTAACPSTCSCWRAAAGARVASHEGGPQQLPPAARGRVAPARSLCRVGRAAARVLPAQAPHAARRVWPPQAAGAAHCLERAPPRRRPQGVLRLAEADADADDVRCARSTRRNTRAWMPITRTRAWARARATTKGTTTTTTSSNRSRMALTCSSPSAERHHAEARRRAARAQGRRGRRVARDRLRHAARSANEHRRL
ncbi:dimethyladenosine transferase [Gracilaria domingensis]|nr:dimethyladenosine transferase [Gracilaria domingensis]